MRAPDGGSPHAVVGGVQDGGAVGCAHRLPLVGQVVLQGQLEVAVHLQVTAHLVETATG